VWLVLVSVGIPGTVFFLVWLLYLFWASRSSADPVSFTVHVAMLIALVQLPFYGWMPTEMFLIMATAALIWRGRDQSALVSGPREATSSRPMPALRG
jgi:glycerol-3-phosphate acyltransferase PlsY